jgi:hypothetical protein
VRQCSQALFGGVVRRAARSCALLLYRVFVAACMYDSLAICEQAMKEKGVEQALVPLNALLGIVRYSPSGVTCEPNMNSQTCT